MSDKQIHELVRRLGASRADVLELESLLGQRGAPIGLDPRSRPPASEHPTFSLDPALDTAAPPGTVHTLSPLPDATLPDLPAAMVHTLSPLPDTAYSPDSAPPTLATLGVAALPTPKRSGFGPGASGHYEDLGLLGRGGMGDVRQVWDGRLGRTMAMKIIKTDLLAHPDSVARFISEAQATAQLTHPGIVPVHDLGVLPDGRHYFTMAEVRGKTLTEVISEVHAASVGPRWGVSGSGWGFRRLIDAFSRVCDAVAYAHACGVIHRDLKPDNIMVGSHGEVLVLDWGLAKVRGKRDLVAEQGDLDTVVTGRSVDEAQATRMGSVAGTPAYMPPEQARGHIDQIDERSDVYALGAVLYHILTGHAPYPGHAGLDVLNQVLAGVALKVNRPVLDKSRYPLPRSEGTAAVSTGSVAPSAVSPQVSSGPPLPEELVFACEKALDQAPSKRYSMAGELGRVVTDWLDGARRREQALAVVEAAQSLQPEVARLHSEATALQARATDQLAQLKSWDLEEKKLPSWGLEDRATALRREAALADLRLEQGLYGALRIDPGLAEAHEALMLRHQAAHRQAEEAHDSETRSRTEVLIHQHLAALPVGSEPARQVSAYLRGDGALSLVTDPPGAEVLLHRYVTHNRRLIPRFVRSLGTTPIQQQVLPRGSYLCLIRHPDRLETRYPVFIGRQEHWDGAGPGSREPHPIWLPQPGQLGPSDCYVPAGWFWSGGDGAALNALPQRRIWSHGFVMRRFPVTNRAYLQFLDALVAAGREEEALRFVPRERSGQAGQQGAMIYGRRPAGGFQRVPDAEGDLWELDWPVMMVDWHGAMAFAEWERQQTGQRWRLPAELEWEKSARGVDGRFHPWGDGFDHSWCCMRENHPGQPLPSVVDSFPIDESVYGVRGMAGNVQDWCQEVYAKAGPAVTDGVLPIPRAITAEPAAVGSRRGLRGGSWGYSASWLRAATRNHSMSLYRNVYLGFRLARGPL